MKIFVVLFLCVASLALGADDDYDYPPKPAVFSCELHYEIEAKKNFRTRQEADEWCVSIGDDYCRAIRAEDRGWDAIFNRPGKLKYESDESYARSRKILSGHLATIVEEGGYYKSPFSQTLWYVSCG
jgi:hypothetical protein